MPYTVQEICDVLEILAPLEYAYEWDNVGLLVGRADKPVSTVLVTLTVTPAVVDLAIEHGVDLIVAHHPLIFKPLPRLRTDEPLGGLLARLLRHDLAVYACHTNLDRAPQGLNEWLAQEVGVREARILIPGEYEGVGLGRVGIIAATTLEALANRLAKLWGSPVRVVGDHERPLEIAAVLGGSGGDFVAEAKAAGAQVLITGDVSYHDALDAQALNLAILDAGHYATEKIMVRKTAQYLRSKLAPGTSGIIAIIEEPSSDPFQLENR